MSSEVAWDIAILFVLIFVVSMTTAPTDKDSEAVKVMKRLARHALTATLIVAVALGGFALYVVRYGMAR